MAGDGVAGHVDGIATKARFHYPSGITMDESTGTLYICDTYNHSIRKITAKGEVSTIAGTGNKGYVEGSKAQFSSPTGIVYFRGISGYFLWCKIKMPCMCQTVETTLCEKSCSQGKNSLHS